MGTTNLDDLALGGDATIAGDLAVTGTITGDVEISSTLLFDDGEAIVDTSSNELLEFTVTATAVNHIGIANAGTGVFPVILAEGEADTGITFVNSEAEEILILDSIATSVNELTIASSATGLPVTVSSTGDDANVDIRLEPKGTGLLELFSDEAGAVGGTLAFNQESASPVATDAVGRIDFSGLDDAANAQDYGRIDCEILDPANGSESGQFKIYAADASGTLSLAGGFSHNGSGGLITAGDGAAAGTFQSSGAQQVILATGDGSGSVNVDTSGSFNVPGGMLAISVVTKTPNNDDGGGSQINPGEVQVEVGAVTNDADDWIILPTLSQVQNGHKITILCNAGTNFELRTPTTSNEEINSEDCDGTKEYLCTDTEVITVVKISDSIGWMAYAHSAIGAAVTAVVPDA
jgi:hypothetical protein